MAQKKEMSETNSLIPRRNGFQEFLGLGNNDREGYLIWKDVGLMGFNYFTFRLCYLSYIFNLGILFDEKLAFTTLATSFGAETVTSLFLPTFLIRQLGCKTVVIAVASTTLLFGVAEFFPSYWTFIPCGILLGAGYSCLWVGLCTYVTNVGHVYVSTRHISLEAILGLFFGLICFLGALGGVTGNVITYLILSQTEHEVDKAYLMNTDVSECGANYCQQIFPDGNSSISLQLLQTDATFRKVKQSSRATLFVTYIILGLVGPVLVTLFLDKRKKLEDSMIDHNVTIAQQIVATIAAMKNVNLALLSVSCFLAGITFSFSSGDYAQAYVHCALGSEFVAVVAVINLLAYSISAFGSGILVKIFGILSVYLFMNISTEAVYVLMLLWQPDRNGIVIAAAFSGWLGAFVANQTTLLSTICGIILHGNREATFAFFRLFYSLGSSVGFAITNNICVWVLIVAFMSLILIGTAMYLLAEYRVRRFQKEH